MLKDNEESRAVTFLSNNLHTLEGNDKQSLVMRKASNHCDDNETEVEDDAEDHMGPLIQPTKMSRKRTTKNGNGLSVKRRSARIETLRKLSK